MKTLGSDNQRTFIVEMSSEEYHALAGLQRVSEGKFDNMGIPALGGDMTNAILAVVAFVQVQDVIGKFDQMLEGLRMVLKDG